MLLKLSLPVASSAKSSQKQPKPSFSITPYQFTLPVMFGLYCHLQGSVKFRKGQAGKIHPASDYVQSDSHKRQEKYRLFADAISDGHPPKPISYHQIHKLAPLRALGYFSWEEERRCFLTRRVFPTNFDFLSYSYVPEGWGALGLMLKDVVEGKYKGRNQAYTEIPNVKAEKTLIPYLQEVERLNYDSILTIPIFKPEKSDIDNLLGAFAFYVNKSENLPHNDSRLKRCFKKFAIEMGSKLIEHDKSIRQSKASLVKILQTSYATKAAECDEDSICELLSK